MIFGVLFIKVKIIKIRKINMKTSIKIGKSKSLTIVQPLLSEDEVWASDGGWGVGENRKAGVVGGWRG